MGDKKEKSGVVIFFTDRHLGCWNIDTKPAFQLQFFLKYIVI